MNRIKIFLYILGLFLLSVGIIMVIVSTILINENLQLASYLIISSSFCPFLIAFFLDFKKTMIDNKTEGDRYTLLTKAALIKEMKKRSLSFEENKSREYYLMILRNDDEEKIIKNNEK